MSSVTEGASGQTGTEPAGSVLKSGAAIASNAGLTLAGSILGAALMMINEILAARLLGIEEYGSYGLAVMLARIGELIALFGVPLSVMHFLPVHLNLSQSRLALGVIIGAIALPMMVAVSFALGAGLWHDWIANYIFNLPLSAGYIAVIACAIPMAVLSEMSGSIARASGRFLPFVVIRNLVPPICYMSGLLYLSASAGAKIGVAFAYTLAAAAGAAAGLVWVLALVRKRIGFVRPVLRLRPLYEYAAPIGLNSMVTIVFIWVDLFLLATLTDGRSVGIYRGCGLIVVTFDLILTACSAATAPVYGVLFAKGHRQQLQETLTAATRIATLLATPLLLIILVNGGDILGLLGPDFEAGRLALTILSVGQLAKVMFGSAGMALILCGKQKMEAGNNALAACLNVALNLFFIPRLELLGAAISTMLSMFVLSALRGSQLWFALRLRIADRMLLRILLVSTPLAALVWGTSHAFGFGPGTGILSLGVRMIVMIVMIGGGMLMFCLKKNERVILIQTIMQRMPVFAGSQRKSRTP